jgi:hypothetical protein
MTDRVEFNHDNDDVVDQIVDRWSALNRQHGHFVDPLSAMMDVKAANGVNGNPELDLEKLLAFDDANFAHDMGGISRHINRETGLVEDCFLARCAKPELEGV